ncbi:hypothetical protein FAZ78_07215 [Cereibacter changlensis]|uniref:Uncharacterized protein n=1 Tax=Cereibacter changlensis TaxID=402884 RepID=A0A4U0YZ85_9RHOB|nr:hypothetical protein FAZ78_07215 [Cereibacter changlensis]
MQSRTAPGRRRTPAGAGRCRAPLHPAGAAVAGRGDRRRRRRLRREGIHGRRRARLQDRRSSRCPHALRLPCRSEELPRCDKRMCFPHYMMGMPARGSMPQQQEQHRAAARSATVTAPAVLPRHGAGGCAARSGSGRRR